MDRDEVHLAVVDDLLDPHDGPEPVDATRRELVDVNVVLLARAPRSQPQARRAPETWTAAELRAFLDNARHLRLYPALHLAAMTGMRRGELAGLRWGDLDHVGHRLSVARSRQSVAGRSVEVAVKTRTSHAASTSTRA